MFLPSVHIIRLLTYCQLFITYFRATDIDGFVGRFHNPARRYKLSNDRLHVYVYLIMATQANEQQNKQQQAGSEEGAHRRGRVGVGLGA